MTKLIIKQVSVKANSEKYIFSADIYGGGGGGVG